MQTIPDSIPKMTLDNLFKFYEIGLQAFNCVFMHDAIRCWSEVFRVGFTYPMLPDLLEMHAAALVWQKDYVLAAFSVTAALAFSPTLSSSATVKAAMVRFF